ncbi:DUF4442 domain-containing protein [Alkalilimnicola ehrlichii]|uniref:DUF4442 domain-containing protein n=1 Tax=Alkalilimnicola ehrlichii TaxID=351052 RepID=A0A3E0WJE8_9GAMM|nr:hotdog fold domain-containing protein [Alkalilimnicola ehrlichii]RFA25193.1 DUF4442 domain-containing protein [Alkalilimnicola ehrlichii]RFA32271.1 DUF4442 domain-containing protein [Alkalilimnicola ehrlichii]
MTTPTLRLYHSFTRFPAGKWIFSRAVCWRAPYFASIRPSVLSMEPGRTRWSMRKRRAVHNHIGTVHALAVGNLCELAAGTLMECTVPADQRWIPKGMQIEYLKKAETDLVAEATLAPEFHGQLGDLPIEVVARDREQQAVVRATIYMYVSEKPKRGA